jgi:hypothetical protein
VIAEGVERVGPQRTGYGEDTPRIR